jgi:hypothetical protein
MLVDLVVLALTPLAPLFPIKTRDRLGQAYRVIRRLIVACPATVTCMTFPLTFRNGVVRPKELTGDTGQTATASGVQVPVRAG